MVPVGRGTVPEGSVATLQTKCRLTRRAEATSMEKFLVALRADHSGAQGWARTAGITATTLTSLHAVLVNDDTEAAD
jgi:hypothetical protein